MAFNYVFSKTDQMGRGKTLPITRELYEMLKDVARKGRQWIDIKGDH